jgi:outer membrane receptor protein involved in Fe transport
MLLVSLLAQAAVAAAPAVPAPPQQGIASYPASYFAAGNTNTALDMVNNLPNFTLDTGDSVRGFEGSAGNVLIGGQRPTSKRDALDAVLQRIPATKVERIDVIRGGAPGIDMQGKTVIANVILKAGSGFRGLIAVANQHVDDGRNLGGLRMEGSGSLPRQTTWEAGWRLGKGADDGIGPGQNLVTFADGRPPQVADIDTHGTDYLSNFTGALETPVLGGRLRINGLTQYEKFKEPEVDVFTSPGPDVVRYGYAKKTIDTEAGGRFVRAFGEATNLELLTLRTTRHRTTDSSSLDADPSVTGGDASSHFFADRHSSELIFRGVLKHSFGRKLSLEVGAENADNKLDSRTRFSVDGEPQDLPAANVQVEEKRTETFLKGAWNPTAAWTVDAALRYEYSDISSQGDVVMGKTLKFAKPRLAVAWTPRNGSQLRFRVEKVVGQLNFDDFVASSSLTTSVGVTAGNPNLNPEQSWVTEAALEQQLWQGSSIEITARHFKISDVVDRGPVFAADGSVFDQPTNIGEGAKDELAAVVTLRFDRFGWKGLLVKGDVTKRWSEVTDPTTRQKREISVLHPVDWNLSVSQDLPARRLNVGFDIYGGWRETSYRFDFIETVKIKPYLKPFAEWKPRPGLSLRVEVPLANHPKVRLRDEIQTFDGPRTAGATPASVQERTFTFPYSWYVRVRKEF